MRRFKCSSCNPAFSIYHKNFCSFEKIFFSIFSLKWVIKTTKFSSRSLNLEFSAFDLNVLFFVLKLETFVFAFSSFLQMVIFTTLFWRWSTLKIITLFGRFLTLLMSTLKTLMIRRCSTFWISILTCRTLFQRWFDIVWCRYVISNLKKFKTMLKCLLVRMFDKSTVAQSRYFTCLLNLKDWS